MSAYKETSVCDTEASSNRRSDIIKCNHLGYSDGTQARKDTPSAPECSFVRDKSKLLFKIVSRAKNG